MSTSRSRVPVAPGMPGWFDPAAGWTPPGNTQGPATPPPPGTVEHGLRQVPAIVEIDRVTGELVRISADGGELPVVTYRSRPDGGNRVTAGGIALQSAGELIDAAPTLPSAGVKVLEAIIRNPLKDVPRVNEPAEIRLTLPDGWAPAVECIRVRDAAGSYVPWQWEPCRHARTDALIATHGSGAIKAGSVWVIVPSLLPGESVTYTVEVWPTAQTQSFTPAITKSAPDSNTDRFETDAWRAEFVAGWSWHLKKFENKVTALDYFGAADSGLDFAYRPSNAGTAEYSGLSTGTKLQSNTFHSERDATTFGYGVVYRWYVSRSVGITEANVQHEVWYRIYVNGRVDIKAIHKALAERPSTDVKLSFSVIKPLHAGGVHDGSNTGLWIKSDYAAGGKLLVQARSSKFNSDADGAYVGGGFPGGTSYYTASPVRLRFGTQDANKVLPINAERREYFSLVIADEFESDRLKIWNPLVTTAAKSSSTRVQLMRFGAQIRSFLQRYTAYSSADSDGARAALLSSAWAAYANAGGYDQWSLVPARIAAWLAHTNRGPADSGLGSRLFSNYLSGLGSSGFEHTGRDATAFFALWREAQRRGDAAVAEQCAAVLRGMCDFAILAEANSGSIGRVRLNYTDGTNNVNLNATAEALMSIAFAKATGYSPNDDVLYRIWDALVAGVNYRNWPPYEFSKSSQPDMAITYQVLSYFHRVMFAIAVVGPIIGRESLIDPLYCTLASTNAQGQADEHRDSFNFERKGSPATLMHFAINMAALGNISDIEQAIQIMTHVNTESPANLPSAHPMDGWGNNVARSVGDALCAMLAMYPLRRLADI